MSNVVVKVSDLTKVYRLYKSNGHRVRAMLGLFPHVPGSFSEHCALDAVNLEIFRGEKIGIIGRNGAGKSTLLKIITGVIKPFSGTLTVKGETQALLQIGTGFHPDFTGRENARAYLAQLGKSGKEAEQLIEQIIEFAEIEEYIDQPIKTYSTGMSVRLMFATSTTIIPDILVIDEVLGVGDAYFAKKSFERIKSLSSESGTTVILVSHDMYAASEICDRIVWLDKGKVCFDGAVTKALDAYEMSIKKQEERRLNLRRMASLKKSADLSDMADMITFDIKGIDSLDSSTALFFYSITLVVDDQKISILSLKLFGS